MQRPLTLMTSIRMQDWRCGQLDPTTIAASDELHGWGKTTRADEGSAEGALRPGTLEYEARAG